MARPRVLIATIVPLGGGVSAMAGFLAECLAEGGYEPVLAHYLPYSLSPGLSVPSFRLLRGSIGVYRGSSFKGHETHAIGAWLPELEFTHYMATEPWKKLIETCNHCVSASGNVLSATAFMQLGKPYLSWVATSWADDRRNRVAAFPWPRRMVDRAVNGPILRRLERRILNSGTVLALSDYTKRTLNRIATRSVVRAVMPMPVDTDLFRPCAGAVVTGRIGFAGRLSDPRKNIDLLLQSVARLAASGVSLHMIGDDLHTTSVPDTIRALGIEQQVSVIPRLERGSYAEHLRTLDVFVVPSHQEGLCIAALEAMACGCPVVSTRCGGPEEFVIDGETGFLVDFDPDNMVDAVASIVMDRRLRARLGAGARNLVEQRYNRDAAAGIFWEGFEATFSTGRAVA